MRNYIFYIILCLLLNSVVNAQSLSVSLQVKEKPCQLGEATITIETGLSPIQYEWSNGAILSSVENLETGDYSVKVTDANSQDTTINFHVENPVCEPVPETHFTPNNDGYNDTWNISLINNFPEFDLYVYNRWGQQVHHQTGNYIPWDGKNLTLPLPDATYYYVLYFSRSNKHQFVKGAVSIIR